MQSFKTIREADEILRAAILRATQGNPPFGASPGPSDATPEEIDAEASSYLTARCRWIAEQWGIVEDAERNLGALLDGAGIERKHWDAFAEGYADAPTAEAYAAACA